jgi:predicted nucleic acid-binding protein
MRFVLDTSAWLAHYRQETGSTRVVELFDEPRNEILVSVVSLVEFYARLKAFGLQSYFESAREAYAPLFQWLPVTQEIAQKAVELREASTMRLPTVDAVIAATAVARNAVLIHRDSHFTGIPAELLHQELLT